MARVALALLSLGLVATAATPSFAAGTCGKMCTTAVQPSPSSVPQRFVANGGTIARNTNTTQLPIGNPHTPPLCGTVTKDNPNVPVPCR
jgi:hypothetical protein